MARYQEQSSSTGGARESAAEAGEHRRTATRQRRIASRSRALSELLEERNELVGVYEPADLAVEMLRWSA